MNSQNESYKITYYPFSPVIFSKIVLFVLDSLFILKILNFSLEVVFDVLEQIKRILKIQKSDASRISPKTDILTDVYDGDIYANFFQCESEGLKLGNVMSYTLNTDGIALCEKSRLSITPIILSLNELPLAERFNIQNVVIAGKLKIQFNSSTFRLGGR